MQRHDSTLTEPTHKHFMDGTDLGFRFFFGPKLYFFIDMVLYNLGALVDVFNVKDFVFVLSEPFHGPDVIPGVHEGTVVECDRSLRGLDHFDSDSGIKGGVGMRKE
jgi:hypothetical protein